MKTSEQLDLLTAALIKVQSIIVNPEKNKKVSVPGKYSFKYSDLPECYDVAKKPLSENGLSHFSTVEYRDKVPFLIMRLQHISGQWIESEWMLNGGSVEKSVAASMTYGKRYLFCALIGIAAEEDIDDPGESNPKTVEDIKRGTNLRIPSAAPIGADSDFNSFDTGGTVIPPTKPESGAPTSIDLDELMKVGTQFGWSKKQISFYCQRQFKDKLPSQLNQNEFKYLIESLKDQRTIKPQLEPAKV
jgi:hypothetical protein